MENLTQLAKNLRKNKTIQEQKLWNLLRNRQLSGYKFRRQYVIENYIVDFVCREKKLVIELDGGQHNEQTNIEYDKKRTLFLEQEGYTVIRFWNNELDNNIDGVYERIVSYLES